jgi:ABC-2 type transport system permease protein
MNKKLKYLTKVSLNKKIKSKWFLVANIIFAILIIGLLNIDSVIKFFGGDFDKETIIYVVDNTNYDILGEFENSMNEYSNLLSMNMNIDTIESYDKFVSKVKKSDDNNSILVVVNEDDYNYMNAKIVSNDKIDTVMYQSITNCLDNIKKEKALLVNGIDTNTMMNINKSISIERVILNKNSKNDNEIIMGVVFPIITLPIFMLTMYLIQMIGAEINEEKSTRGMEIIISNVSPKTHFISKLLSGNIFVLLQGILLLVYILIGVYVRFNICGNIDFSSILGSSGIDVMDSIKSITLNRNIILVLILSLILIILSFIGYSLLSAICASMTTSMEDYQQVQTPIVLTSLAGYYLSIMASMFNGSVFIRVLSYVPFIGTMLSPSLYILGDIGIIDIIISICLMVGTIFILMKYGLKIYKVGILNYSGSHIWKKMFKAAKER